MANQVNTKKISEQEEASISNLSSELKEVTERKINSWLYEYKDKKTVGGFLLNGTDEEEHTDGFKYFIKELRGHEYIYSDSLRKEGVLSICQSIQSYAAIFEGLDQKPSEEDAAELRLLVGKLLERLKRSKRKSTHKCKYRYDVTPYLDEARYEKMFENAGYIDTVTWVATTVLALFRLHLRQDLDYSIDDETQKELVSIYRDCVSYLNEAFIGPETKELVNVGSDEAPSRFEWGWNYKYGVKSPSLYFTYTATELMLDILRTFKNVLGVADVAYIKEEIARVFPDVNTPRERKAVRDKITLLETENAEALAAAADGGKAGEAYRREYEIFKQLNDDFDVYELATEEAVTEENGETVTKEETVIRSPYYIYEIKVKAAAKNLWRVVGGSIANSFFSATLTDRISPEVIDHSATSDALFNSIFLINIFLNAGLDEEADDKINYYTYSDSDAYYKAVSEYDEIRDSMRLGYDTVYQKYAELQKNGKDYKVNEYLLAFGEDIGKEEEENAKELRKARIRPFSLMPLLAKTKTALGEYLIRYPQYDMQIYLEKILQHRLEKSAASKTADKTKKGYVWVWEKDGYAASDNYYFVTALASFFDYYEDYEKSVLDSAKEQMAHRQIKQGYEDELKRKDEELARRDEEIERYKLLLEREREKVASGGRLSGAIAEIVEQTIKERIGSIFSLDSIADILNGVSSSIKENASDRVRARLAQKKPKEGEWYDAEVAYESKIEGYDSFESSMHSLAASLMHERMLEAMSDDNRNELLNPDSEEHARVAGAKLENAEKYVLGDMAGVTRSYLKSTAAHKPSGLDRIIADAGKGGALTVDEDISSNAEAKPEDGKNAKGDKE